MKCVSLILASVGLAASITTAELESLKADILATIPTSPTAGLDSPRANALGAMVRLPFHDAFGFGTKADGCLDPNEADHHGLEDIRVVVDPICASYADKLSRADCWAVVGNVAIAAAQGTEPAEPAFRFGRVDCANEADVSDAGLLPSADPGGNAWTHVEDVFVTRGGLTVKDVVALLGAHSLGQTHSDDKGSGFTALPWIPTNTVLSNRYHRDINNVPWTRQDIGTNGASKIEWVDRPPNQAAKAIMLETDMALVIDTSSCTAQQGPIRFGGQQNPNPANCAFNPEPQAFVAEFANNNRQFLAFFALAMQKLEEVGYTEFTGDAETPADWTTTLCEVTATSDSKTCGGAGSTTSESPSTTTPAAGSTTTESPSADSTTPAGSTTPSATTPAAGSSTEPPLATTPVAVSTTAPSSSAAPSATTAGSNTNEPPSATTAAAGSNTTGATGATTIDLISHSFSVGANAISYALPSFSVLVTSLYM